MVEYKNRIESLYCSQCKREIWVGDPHIRYMLPIGTVLAPMEDGFEKNRGFCNQNCFDKFYIEHSEELPSDKA